MIHKNHQQQAHGADVIAELRRPNMEHQNHQQQPYANVAKEIPLVKMTHKIHKCKAHGFGVAKEIPQAKNGTPNSPVPGSQSRCN